MLCCQNPIDIYTPISLVDVAPTLLDLVAIEKPDYLHGRSFRDALDGNTNGLEGLPIVTLGEAMQWLALIGFMWNILTQEKHYCSI
jgi:hypothetical protein